MRNTILDVQLAIVYANQIIRHVVSTHLQCMCMHACMLRVQAVIPAARAIYITFSIWGAMSLAKVENVAALQLFTLGGSGGMPPQEILTILGACSEVLLVH